MGNNIHLVDTPKVVLLAEPSLSTEGLEEFVKCVPETCKVEVPWDLNPNPEIITAAEFLVELAGRKCYNSFGAKAGRKSNKEYIDHTQSSDIPHSSIMYHVHLTFFIGNISRRVSHELVRHYVGCHRDTDGSISQESTRYVPHDGTYVWAPDVDFESITYSAQANRRLYLKQIEGYDQVKGMERKRILEKASGFLLQQAASTLIWTGNPVALNKMFKERTHEAADLEFRRLCVAWRELCKEKFPNLFW